MYHHNRIAVILAVLVIITLASSVEAAEDHPLFIFPSEADISYVPCMDVPPCSILPEITVSDSDSSMTTRGR